jgi:hypothetical protein
MNWGTGQRIERVLFLVNGHGLASSAALPLSKNRALIDIYNVIKLLHLDGILPGKAV